MLFVNKFFFVKEREKKKKKIEVIGGEGDENGKVAIINKWFWNR